MYVWAEVACSCELWHIYIFFSLPDPARAIAEMRGRRVVISHTSHNITATANDSTKRNEVLKKYCNIILCGMASLLLAILLLLLILFIILLLSLLFDRYSACYVNECAYLYTLCSLWNIYAREYAAICFKCV